MAEPKLKPRGFLRSKITDPAIGREVSALSETVATIAADNKTPFFPAYTDHGIDHLQAVLDWCVKLTPKGARRILGENDAAVIIGGALLHDVAMHLHVPGFVELVSGDWPAPLPWFDRPHGRRPADRPWDQLWEDFKAEARHFDHTEIVRLLGPDHEGTPKVVFEDDIRRLALDEVDRLYIGEFLRRHHARLAHEIAVHGFPGLEGDFPEAANGLPTTLRELMGLVARSHNEDLRTLVDHMEEHRGSLERSGVHVPFAAALLRIADFAQLDFQRAPSLLLRMAAPQSQISIDEWTKHRAVQLVDDDGDDPDAIRIEVSPDIELPTYLQLEELFDGLQHELDTCSAVLAEEYGSTRKLAPLHLTKRRLRHNMATPEFQDALTFVPRESRLRSAEDMFRLVIHDLYGDHPWVAGRELAQNALDAVRERWRVEAPSAAVRPTDEGWPDAEDPSVDVLIEVVVDDDDQLTLRVVDRGIGMTADTVIDYFLKAGASLGPTPRELAEVPEGDAARYVKAGRFGIGVLAAFLLGDEVEVRTRHLTEDTGLSFTARLDSDLVPITRGVHMPVGTAIEIRSTKPLAQFEILHRVVFVDDEVETVVRRSRPVVEHPPSEVVEVATKGLGRPIRDACALDSPQLRVVVGHEGHSYEVPMWSMGKPSATVAHDDWRTFAPAGFGEARWHPGGDVRLVHNGIRISDATQQGSPPYVWSAARLRRVLQYVSVDVIDPRHLVPLTLNRFSMRTSSLPFERELLTSIALEAIAAGVVHRLPPSPVQPAWGWWIHGPGGLLPAVPEVAADAGIEMLVEVLMLEGDGFELAPEDLDQGWDRGPARSSWIWQRRAQGLPPRYPGYRNLERITDTRIRSLDQDMWVVGCEARYVRCGGAHRPTLEALAEMSASHDDPPADVSSALDEILDWTLRGHAKRAVVLVAGPASARGSDERSGILAETWMEIVGGPVPYDDAEREALAERVYEEHPEMRPHIDRQRRIAAEDARLDG